MAFMLTKNARLASEKTNLEPQLVLKIEGVSTLYGVQIISKKVRIGDPEVIIGGGWKIGGGVAIADQSDLISLDGTTTSIRQQLQPDKGSGSSISSMTVALVDRSFEATELVSPGVVVDDMLGRKARVYLSADAGGTRFPDDYITIFRGIVDDIQGGAGRVALTLSHPDQKKRQTLFPKIQTTLVDPMTAIQGTCLVASSDNFAHGIAAQGLKAYFKIGDEYVLRTKTEFTNFYLLTRGQFGTTATTHAAGDTVETFYRLQGNIIDLALRLMLSDENFSPYAEDLSVSSFVKLDDGTTATNGVFFRDVDMEEEYGITVGDKMITSDADESSNNVSLSNQIIITGIEKRYDGTVIYLGNAALVEERDTPAVAKFISQYNVLGAGLGMSPDEVDIEEHLRVKKLFLSAFTVDIYIRDEENIKELIEKDLYAVAGAYSLPRKSKASIGYHIGPIPGTKTPILSRANIKDPSKIQIRRSLANNFFNTIIYKIDQELESDEYQKGIVTRSEDSVNRIPVGTKALVVEARGLRSTDNGENLATAASNRRLNRYKFGAEYIEQLRLNFKAGFTIEVGDIVLLDATGLNLLNSKDGDRSPAPKLYEVINRSIDLKTGDVSLSLVDTSYSTASKYALVAPSSKIKSASSGTEFVLEAAYNTETYGVQEGNKWSRFLASGGTVGVRVRSDDFTRNASAEIESVTGNSVRLKTSLGFVAQSGDVMEVAALNAAVTNDLEKTLYGFMSPLSGGADPYKMI